jgi:hypothetical protein
MADLNAALRTSLTGPASMTEDGRSVSEHSIGEQIRAVRFQMATRARSRNGLAGMSVAKLSPHGAMLTGIEDLYEEQGL